MDKFKYCRRGSVIHDALMAGCIRWVVTGRTIHNGEKLTFIHSDSFGGQTISNYNSGYFHLQKDCPVLAEKRRFLDS